MNGYDDGMFLVEKHCGDGFDGCLIGIVFGRVVLDERRVSHAHLGIIEVE